MSRVAQHWKLFWGFLFWLSGRHYMCCRNFECKLKHRGRKTLYLDQLVVWEWSVVLTTKDLQLIKEANDGPWLRKLAMSHYIRDSIHERMSSMWLHSLFGRHETRRSRTDLYIETRRGRLHPLKVRLVEKMFATKFNELTTTRFWSSVVIL